jgi:hypothetical protein
MQRQLDDIVRGIYTPTTDPDTWQLMPTPSRVRPWASQHALPVAFRLQGDELVPIAADGTTDRRFPAKIKVATVHPPNVVRGHMTHTLRGGLALGSLYVYAPTSTERWVEFVTKGIDMNDANNTHRRIIHLMGNDDPEKVAQHRQRVSMVLFEHTPTTVHTPDQLLTEK